MDNRNADSSNKAAPGYQRPGNLKNPTVATLLRKVMEMDGTEAAMALKPRWADRAA